MTITTSIYVELHVPNLDVAIEFYKQLGFKVVWRRGEDLQLMIMQSEQNLLKFYGGNEQIFQQSYFKQFPQDTPRGYGVEIIMPVANVEDIYRKFTERYSKNIVSGLRTRWSKQEFRVVDPFGYYFRIVEDYDWINDWGGM